MSSMSFCSEISGDDVKLGYIVADVIDEDGTGGLELEPARVKAVIYKLPNGYRGIKLIDGYYVVQRYGKHATEPKARWHLIPGFDATRDPAEALRIGNILANNFTSKSFEEHEPPEIS